jgi:hypothetical protein
MLFADGQYWWITKMRGLRWIECERWDGPRRYSVVLNLSAVRWNEYTDKAVSLIKENRDLLEGDPLR